MLINTELRDDGLAVMRLTGRIAHASSLKSLTETVTQLDAQGRRGILLDHTKVKRISMAGLAALVELVARHAKSEIGFCALPEKALRVLRNSGLDRGLHIFNSIEDACRTPLFQCHALSGTRAVLLCAGKGSRVAPLTEVAPKPMLDIAGQPTLHRILSHLEQFGLRDVIFNPGHLGYQVIDYFRHKTLPDHNIFFANEGQGTADHWQADPIGSASTLKRLQNNNAAFASDVIVLCGDALIDLDLGEMMRDHRASGADVTIAALTVPETDVHKYGMIETGPNKIVRRFVEKPKPGTTDSRLANTGIYIFKPQVLDLIPLQAGLDIACDLLPAVMQSGGTMRVFDKPFSWIDIGCGRDYARALHMTLTGHAPGVAPQGREIRPGVWAMSGAQVSRRAIITGPCHIGAHARIDAGAQIEGLCTIGEGVVVQGNTFLRNTIVMPDTEVAAGAWAENMILHGDWAVDHTRADGSVQTRDPLEGVTPVQTLSEVEVKKLA